jgi:uncharacterized protein (TIGR04222 family)
MAAAGAAAAAAAADAEVAVAADDSNRRDAPAPTPRDFTVPPRPIAGLSPDHDPMAPAPRRERRPTPAELLARLEAFGLSPADEPLAFETRLADDQGWTLGHALAVTAEYRRFLVLTQLAGQPVSPAPDVDEAWHLHLTRTAHYEQFCRAVFGRFLHHEPAGAAAGEVRRHRDMYEATRDAYRDAFGAEPPEAVWPRPGRLLPPDPAPAPRWTVPEALRPGRRLAWACIAAALVLCLLPGAARLLSPLMGPSVDVFLLEAVLAAALLVWVMSRTTASVREPHRRDTLEPYEAAWFAGGAARMAMTAIAALVERGVLRQPADGDRVGLPRHALAVDRGSAAPPRHPVEAACLRAASDAGLLFADACTSVRFLADASERRLAAAGLVAARGTMPLARARALALFTLWLAVCFERCRQAFLETGHGGELVVTLGIAIATAWLVSRLARRPTRVAARAALSLKSLGGRFGRSGTAKAASGALPLAGEGLAMAVALAGTAAFAGDLRFAGLDDRFGALGLPARRLTRKKLDDEDGGGSGFGAPSGLGSAFGGALGASCGTPGSADCGSGASGDGVDRGAASWDGPGAVDLGGGSNDGGGSSCSGGSSCGSSCSSGSSCGGGGGSSD